MSTKILVIFLFLSYFLIAKFRIFPIFSIMSFLLFEQLCHWTPCNIPVKNLFMIILNALTMPCKYEAFFCFSAPVHLCTENKLFSWQLKQELKNVSAPCRLHLIQCVSWHTFWDFFGSSI